MLKNEKKTKETRSNQRSKRLGPMRKTEFHVKNFKKTDEFLSKNKDKFLINEKLGYQFEKDCFEYLTKVEDSSFILREEDIKQLEIEDFFLGKTPDFVLMKEGKLSARLKDMLESGKLVRIEFEEFRDNIEKLIEVTANFPLVNMKKGNLEIIKEYLGVEIIVEVFYSKGTDVVHPENLRSHLSEETMRMLINYDSQGRLPESVNSMDVKMKNRLESEKVNEIWKKNREHKSRMKGEKGFKEKVNILAERDQRLLFSDTNEFISELYKFIEENGEKLRSTLKLIDDKKTVDGNFTKLLESKYKELGEKEIPFDDKKIKFTHKSKANLPFPIDLACDESGGNLDSVVELIGSISTDLTRKMRYGHVIRMLKKNEIGKQNEASTKVKDELREKIRKVMLDFKGELGSDRKKREIKEKRKEVRSEMKEKFKKEFLEVSGKKWKEVVFFAVEGYFRLNFNKHQFSVSMKEHIQSLSENGKLSWKAEDMEDFEECKDFREYLKSGQGIEKMVKMMTKDPKESIMIQTEMQEKRRMNKFERLLKPDLDWIPEFLKELGKDTNASCLSEGDEEILCDDSEDSLGFKNEVRKEIWGNFKRNLLNFNRSKLAKIAIQIESISKSMHRGNGVGSKVRDVSISYCNSKNIASFGFGDSRKQSEDCKPYFSIIKIRSEHLELYQKIYSDNCTIYQMDKTFSLVEITWRRVKNNHLTHCMNLYSSLVGLFIHSFGVVGPKEDTKKDRVSAQDLAIPMLLLVTSSTAVGKLYDSDPKIRANIINKNSIKTEQFSEIIELPKTNMSLFLMKNYASYLDRLTNRMKLVRGEIELLKELNDLELYEGEKSKMVLTRIKELNDYFFSGSSKYLRVIKKKTNDKDELNLFNKYTFPLPLLHTNVDECWDFNDFQSDAVYVKLGNKDSISSYHRYIKNSGNMMDANDVLEDLLEYGESLVNASNVFENRKELFETFLLNDEKIGFSYEASYHFTKLKIIEMKELNLKEIMRRRFSEVMNTLLSSEAKVSASRGIEGLVNMKLHTAICNLLDLQEKGRRKRILTTLRDVVSEVFQLWEGVSGSQLPKLPLRTYFYNKDQRFTNREFYILDLLYRLFLNSIDKMFWEICDKDVENNIRDKQKNREVTKTLRRYRKKCRDDLMIVFNKEKERIKMQIKDVKKRTDEYKKLNKDYNNLIKNFDMWYYSIDCSKWSPYAITSEYLPIHRAMFDVNVIDIEMRNIFDMSIISSTHKFVEYPRFVKTIRGRDEVELNVSSGETFIEDIEKFTEIKLTVEEKKHFINKFWTNLKNRGKLLINGSLSKREGYLTMNYSKLWDSFYYVISWMQGQKQHASSFKHTTIASGVRSLFLEKIKDLYKNRKISKLEFELLKLTSLITGNHSDDKFMVCYCSEYLSKEILFLTHCCMKLTNLRLSVKKTNFGEFIFEYLSTYFRDDESYFPSLKIVLTCIDNTRFEGFIKNSIELHNRVGECVRVGVRYDQALMLRNLINFQLVKKYRSFYDPKSSLIHLGGIPRYSILSMVIYGTRSLFLPILDNPDYSNKDLLVLNELIFNKYLSRCNDFQNEDFDSLGIIIPIIKTGFERKLGRCMKQAGMNGESVGKVKEFVSKYPIYDTIKPNNIIKGKLKLQSDYLKSTFMNSFDIQDPNQALRRYYAVEGYPNLTLFADGVERTFSVEEYKDKLLQTSKSKLSEEEVRNIASYLKPISDVSSVIMDEVKKYYSVKKVGERHNKSGNFRTVWKTFRQSDKMNASLPLGENPAIVAGSLFFPEEVMELRPNITKEEIESYSKICIYWLKQIGFKTEDEIISPDNFNRVVNILGLYKGKSRECWIDTKYDNNLLGYVRSVIKHCTKGFVFISKDSRVNLVLRGEELMDAMGSTFLTRDDLRIKNSIKIMSVYLLLRNKLRTKGLKLDGNSNLSNLSVNGKSVIEIGKLGDKLMNTNVGCYVHFNAIKSIIFEESIEFSKKLKLYLKIKDKDKRKIPIKCNVTGIKNKGKNISIKNVFIEESGNWRMCLNSVQFEKRKSILLKDTEYKEELSRFDSEMDVKYFELIRSFYDDESSYRKKLGTKTFKETFRRKSDKNLRISLFGGQLVLKNEGSYLSCYSSRFGEDNVENLCELDLDEDLNLRIGNKSFNGCHHAHITFTGDGVFEFELSDLEERKFKRKTWINVGEFSNQIKTIMSWIDKQVVEVNSKLDCKLIIENLDFFECLSFAIKASKSMDGKIGFNLMEKELESAKEDFILKTNLDLGVGKEEKVTVFAYHMIKTKMDELRYIKYRNRKNKSKEIVDAIKSIETKYLKLYNEKLDKEREEKLKERSEVLHPKVFSTRSLRIAMGKLFDYNSRGILSDKEKKMLRWILRRIGMTEMLIEFGELDREIEIEVEEESKLKNDPEYSNVKEEISDTLKKSFITIDNLKIIKEQKGEVEMKNAMNEEIGSSQTLGIKFVGERSVDRSNDIDQRSNEVENNLVEYEEESKNMKNNSAKKDPILKEEEKMKKGEMEKVGRSNEGGFVNWFDAIGKEVDIGSIKKVNNDFEYDENEPISDEDEDDY